MTKFAGRRGELLVARETTRGTATTTNAFAVPYATMSFGDAVTNAREEEGLGKLADSDSQFVTLRAGEGEFESETYDKVLGLFLYSLLGSAPVTTGVNPYTHTYTLSNSNQHTSLSLLYQDPDVVTMFPLGVVNSWNLSVEPAGIVRHTWGFMSKGSRDWTRQTPNYTSLGSKFLHQHLQVRLATSIAGLAAATAISLKGLDLTISANTTHDSVLGTVEPEDVLNQQFSVEASLTLNKEDDTYRGFMLNGTYRAMEIKLVNGANSILTLQFPRVDFSQWEQDRGLNTIVTQTVQAKANYDAANALDIISTATLVNTQASY